MTNESNTFTVVSIRVFSVESALKICIIWRSASSLTCMKSKRCANCNCKTWSSIRSRSWRVVQPNQVRGRDNSNNSWSTRSRMWSTRPCHNSMIRSNTKSWWKLSSNRVKTISKGETITTTRIRHLNSSWLNSSFNSKWCLNSKCLRKKLLLSTKLKRNNVGSRIRIKMSHLLKRLWLTAKWTRLKSRSWGKSWWWWATTTKTTRIRTRTSTWTTTTMTSRWTWTMKSTIWAKPKICSKWLKPNDLPMTSGCLQRNLNKSFCMERLLGQVPKACSNLQASCMLRCTV